MSPTERVLSPRKQKLLSWLNKNMKIEMTDGRILVGIFLCTDRDRNVILGSCSEYLKSKDEDPRVLGLAMVPGHHIISIHVDESPPPGSAQEI
ncbi:N-alpha-acetyltransferase 38, NatC auxiliary subunit-like isoform X2 [Limulus polyphemus]|uniref:N-alpha-acetyltransferase 38, NatC auxiliary subunit-like isoform X2 n=1 Tax=Limulus polyphemus TaxID=6850 RepID=A0ABM1TED0_LIMPO|nr:N-alpha-acetyltransferase 38, NatC auxiliary subunit-like isoform X2 [Limulus polyphemus]